MALIVSAQYAKVQTQEAEGCGLGLDVLRRRSMLAFFAGWPAAAAWLCPSSVVGDRRGEHMHEIETANFADRAIKSKERVLVAMSSIQIWEYPQSSHPSTINTK